MIDWLIDRAWAWKNRDELAAIDAQMDFLAAESRRLDGEMEKMFGADWREQAERRLNEVMSIRLTSS